MYFQRSLQRTPWGRSLEIAWHRWTYLCFASHPKLNASHIVLLQFIILFFSISSTREFRRFLWPLYWSNLQIQPVVGSNTVWRVWYQLLGRSLPTAFDYELLRLPNHNIGLTAGVTGQQGVLSPVRHLIPSLVCPGVRICLYFLCNVWNW